jgi:hypothetical protein
MKSYSKYEEGLDFLLEFNPQTHDMEILEIPVIISIPKSAKNKEGIFIGVDRLKQDIRGIEDITTVNSIDQVRTENFLVAKLIIKVNMRSVPDEPNVFLRRKLIPRLKELFARKDVYIEGDAPRLVNTGKPTFPKRKRRPSANPFQKQRDKLRGNS